jgi:hypothetical protein
MQQRSEIRGWGADAALEDRPGVPAELDPPRPLGNMSLGMPTQQTVGRPSVKSRQRPLPPVYGTAIPPRGLSGIVRRLAYRVPDYKPRRWMLLLIADRIDVIEHGFVSKALLVGLAIGAFGLTSLRSSRSRRGFSFRRVFGTG